MPHPEPVPSPRPLALELDREKGLAIAWSDGARHFLPVAWLRRHSPSADQRELRAALARNPLTVLPAARSEGPLRADAVEPVGHYALRIRFSDGHDTGIYTWEYLRRLGEDAGAAPPRAD